MTATERVALVTGASSGIGRAIAQRLAADGCRVALVGRSRERLEETKKSIAAGAVFVAELTDEAAIVALPAAVEAALGPVSILVNNAGIAESSPLHKTTTELWRRTLDVDLTAVFLLIRSFLPRMIESGFGRVIQVASTAGKVGYPYVSAYCAAKHGVLGLTRAVALEVAKSGVTVNAVCPSYVDTPMTDRSVANIAKKTGRDEASARAALAATNPQGRLVTPDEVASAVAYLASESARGVNGQALNLCGGALAY